MKAGHSPLLIFFPTCPTIKNCLSILEKSVQLQYITC